MKRLFVIISAVMLLASCESNRSTFIDVEDGKLLTLMCGSYNVYINTGDTIVYSSKTSSSHPRPIFKFYGLYNGKAIPKDTEWDHWSKVDSSFTWVSTMYDIAIKVD